MLNLAYAVEFDALGILVAAYVLAHGKKLRSSWSTIVLGGVLVVLTDEKIFYDYTSVVKDIWIDSDSFSLGMLHVSFLVV